MPVHNIPCEAERNFYIVSGNFPCPGFQNACLSGPRLKMPWPLPWCTVIATYHHTQVALLFNLTEFTVYPFPLQLVRRVFAMTDMHNLALFHVEI